ncbi:Cytochrome d ubiquinol oxidase subunit 1 [Raoultella terrigena]|uniref:Cytochrome d ubiquinol oxidase subunit 1 n=1 Tax=Raoultella terrigena TaxID=577 RepID=A0A4U9DBG4_RAOTE|nr:Cytochrome d ubiquinol oxidase subunit 1 [Raoultella terrigena]
MAFFLESTFVGLFFFGWDRLGKVQHMAVTWLVALGSNLSALWILVANGWMQNPIASDFNFETMRMEMVSFSELVLNPVAQVKFVHTVASGYVCGAMFVPGHQLLLYAAPVATSPSLNAPLPSRQASVWPLFSPLSFSVMSSGYEMGDVQKTKLAAIEAEWETQPGTGRLHPVWYSRSDAQKNRFAIQIPYRWGLLPPFRG